MFRTESATHFFLQLKKWAKKLSRREALDLFRVDLKDGCITVAMGVERGLLTRVIKVREEVFLEEGVFRLQKVFK